MSKIDISVIHLHAKIQTLEKCHAMLTFIDHTLADDEYVTTCSEKDPFRDAFTLIRHRIRSAQGSAWNDIAMWSPLNEKAQRLIKTRLEKYVDGKINYSMDHLLPRDLRNSITSKEELKAELAKQIHGTVDECKTETVEVPKRAIDINL